MSKAELLEIRFDLPPREPGGKNRVSYIEVLYPSGFMHTRRLTLSEPLKNIRTVRDEYYVTQNDEAPRTSFWVNFISGLKNRGSEQTKNKEVLARSQVSCFDTGRIESRKLDIFPVALGGHLHFTEEEEFNASGHLSRHLKILYNSSGQPKYCRQESFDWETGLPVTDQESWFLIPNGSVCLITKTFDPKTGVIAQEERWAKTGEHRYMDRNSGRVMARGSGGYTFYNPSLN